MKYKCMKYTTGDIVTGYFGKGVIVDIREESIFVWTGHNVEVIDSSMYAVLKTGYRANFDDCISSARYKADPQDISNRLYEADVSENKLTKLVYLAIKHILPDGSVKDMDNDFMRVQDIIDFLNTYYDCSYKTGTRETIRKEAITELLDKNLIESNDRPKQSPYYGYRIKIEIGGKRK